MTRKHYEAQLQQLDEQILELGEMVGEAVAACIKAMQERDVASAQQLIQADSGIDAKRYDIERRALVLIATQQPLATDLRTITAVLIIAAELERIGDYCDGIAKLTLRMAAEPIVAPLAHLRAMAEHTQRSMRDVLRAFDDRDLAGAGDVWSRDDEIDASYEEVFRTLIAEMIADPSTVRAGTYLLWVAHNVERMGDRITNIAERVAFIVTGDVASFREKELAQSPPT